MGTKQNNKSRSSQAAKLKKLVESYVKYTINPNSLGTFDIVIYQDLAEPKRIYRKTLVETIEKHKHTTSYDDAKVELIRRAEEELESIKRIYAP